MSVTFSAELTGEPVNMANSNAARVLGTLGYAEPYGDEDARRLIDCGRSQGYVQSRLHELRELAEYAQAQSLRVTWG